MVNNTIYKAYKSYISPNVGDMISISETEIFVVEQRVHNIFNENSLILTGKLI